MSSSSVNDILLSFLSDIGADQWSDSFQFPELEYTDMEILVGGTHFGKLGTDNDVKCGYKIKQEPFNVSSDVSACSSPVYSTYSSDVDSDAENEVSKGWDWDKLDAAAICTPRVIDYCEVQALVAMKEIIASKKRKVEEHPSKQPRESIEMKKAKQSPEEKVVTLVSMLRLSRQKKESTVPYRNSDPIGTAEALLKGVLTSKTANAKDLLKVFAPTAAFSSTGVSSLHAQAQLKRAQMQLNAWMPSKQVSLAFPERHSGVGQITGAARTFISSIQDLLPIQVANKVQFSVDVVKDSVVISPEADQLASQFSWRSVGLVALGQASEIEFNGLIRCSFGKDGVSSASISFDACSPVRQCSNIFI